VIRLGLIRNPRSTRNKHGGGDFRVLAAQLLGLFYAEPATPEELAETLADFARHEVGIIAIDGGDGTVREVLTALPGAYGEDLPALSIIASGKTNLIAADVGTPGHGPKAVARLVDAARQGRLGSRIHRRPVLEAAWADGSRPPVIGMFLGAGAFTRGTALAQTEVHAKGVNHGPAVALTIATVMARVLRGNDADGWLTGEPMRLSKDGAEDPKSARFLMLATTLQRLVLGIWPFWGGGAEPIRWLDIEAHPRRLARALVPVMRGKPRPWMEAGGYHSGTCTTLDMNLSGDFIMDGEVFSPGPLGSVRLTAARTIDFVIP
jgi:hypothetical protein